VTEAAAFFTAGFATATVLWGGIVYIVYRRNQHYRKQQFTKKRRRNR